MLSIMVRVVRVSITASVPRGEWRGRAHDEHRWVGDSTILDGWAGMAAGMMMGPLTGL